MSKPKRRRHVKRGRPETETVRLAGLLLGALTWFYAGAFITPLGNEEQSGTRFGVLCAFCWMPLFIFLWQLIVAIGFVIREDFRKR